MNAIQLTIVLSCVRRYYGSLTPLLSLNHSFGGGATIAFSWALEVFKPPILRSTHPISSPPRLSCYISILSRFVLHTHSFIADPHIFPNLFHVHSTIPTRLDHKIPHPAFVITPHRPNSTDSVPFPRLLNHFNHFQVNSRFVLFARRAQPLPHPFQH